MIHSGDDEDTQLEALESLASVLMVDSGDASVLTELLTNKGKEIMLKLVQCFSSTDRYLFHTRTFSCSFSFIPHFLNFIICIFRHELHLKSVEVIHKFSFRPGSDLFDARITSSLIALLGSPHQDVVFITVKVLANVTGGTKLLRDRMINEGLIDSLLVLVKPNMSVCCDLKQTILFLSHGINLIAYFLDVFGGRSS